MDERLARMEEKMSLMHEDVKALKKAHLEAVEFKGAIKVIKVGLVATWGMVLSLFAAIIGVWVKQ